MEDFKAYLQRQGKSQSTVKHYNSYLLDFLAWLDITNLEIENATAKEVLSYLNHLQNKGQSNKTRGIRLNVIKQFFNCQVEQGKRADNPVQHVKIRGSKTKKLYPILDRQQLESLYNRYEVPTEHDERSMRNWFDRYRLSKQRNKAILSLLINQGLTTVETERLTVSDLKLKEGNIYIAGSRRSNERTLALKSNQIMELMEYALQVRQSFIPFQEDQQTNRLFLSVPGAGQQKASDSLQIWKGFTKELKAQYNQNNQSTGSSFINFKQVRTSVITHWLKQYNLREVQYMAGHRYVSSTESYLVNQTDDLQADIDNYHPLG